MTDKALSSLTSIGTLENADTGDTVYIINGGNSRQAALGRVKNLAALSPVDASLIIGNGTNWTTLAKGTAGYHLQSDTGGLEWTFAREILTANRTYYVRTDGSDSNTGVTDDAAGAFLTIQHAYDVIADTLDLSDYIVTIQVGDGTRNGQQLFVTRPWIGGNGGGQGAVRLRGNVASPSSCILDAQGNHSIWFQAGIPGIFNIDGFKFVDTVGGGTGIFNNASGSRVYLGDGIDFGNMTATGTHMWLAQASTIFNYNKNYTISGSARRHALVEVGGTLDIELSTITLTGTPDFASAFISVESGGKFYSAVTYSGSATGKRFLARSGGSIRIVSPTFTDVGSAAFTTLPGDEPGDLLGGTLNEYTGNFLVMGCSGAAVSHTGNTNETTLATVTIPGGSMGPNGVVRVTSLWSVTNSSNNKALIIRFGGTSGTAYQNITVTTVGTVHFVTLIRNRNSANSQVGHASGAGLPFGTSGGAVTTSSVDTANDVDLVVRGTLASAGETITLESYMVEVLGHA
jgi:hypothetical protein